MVKTTKRKPIGGSFHEKGVAVKIAVDILVGAYENSYDRLILVSSDTDLLPAIQKAREEGKEIEDDLNPFVVEKAKKK